MLKKVLTLFLVVLVSQNFIFATAIQNEDKNMTRTDICKKKL